MHLNFVMKDYNNEYFEWGRNCATLLLGRDRAAECVENFKREVNKDAWEQFWLGYEEGPREGREIYTLT